MNKYLHTVTRFHFINIIIIAVESDILRCFTLRNHIGRLLDLDELFVTEIAQVVLQLEGAFLMAMRTLYRLLNTRFNTIHLKE